MKTLQANLDIVKKLINEKDFDWLHVVEGYEGSGKSTLAWHICKYIDPKFTVHQVVFTPDQLTMLLKNARKGSAILIDEGGLMLFSRNAMQSDNIELIQILTAIRAKNLFVCICVPSYLILDKYVREHRIKSLTRVISRGWFHFHSKKNINQIFINPKNKAIIYPEPNFKEAYPKISHTEWQAYLKKKGDVLDRLTKWYTTGDVAKIFHVTPTTPWLWCKKGKIKCEQTESGHYRIPSSELEKMRKRPRKVTVSDKNR